jgi:uncharacterized protein YqgC (DUF456 family)
LHTFLHILALIGLDLVLLCGVIAVPLGLSGNFILLGAALLTALLTGFTDVGWIALVVMTVAVIAGEVVEALLGSLVARKFGATKWGMLGAFAGGLGGAFLGTLVLPVIGSVIGSFLGAAAGAMVFELAGGQKTEPGLRAGWGAFVGKVLASGFKMGIGVGIAAYLVIRTHL